MSIGLDDRKAVSVARHPILDHAGHIFGYELLYRGESDAADSKSASENGESTDDLAGARVLTDGILAVGLDALTCGLRAFVKLTHHLLVDGAATVAGHGGSVAGYTAHVAFDPESKVGVILLRNYGAGRTNLGGVANQTVRATRGTGRAGISESARPSR